MAIGDESQAAIVELMHGNYQRILPIETQWGIRLHEGDMRPRIEHFHDAVRALTSGSADMYAKNSRLAVEQLAYDIAQLRQVQQKPVGLINRATEHSISSTLVRHGEAGASPTRMPPQGVRSELVALYRDYTVFFAALFAAVADRNFQSRSDAVDDAVSDIAQIEDIIGKLIAGKITAAQASQELMHVERDDLRERLQALLARKNVSARDKQEALALLAQIEQGLEREKKSVEQAHLHYATGQLAVYEDAKDTIKKLANAGLNLAGKFVEQSLRAAGQGKGRGV